MKTIKIREYFIMYEYIYDILLVREDETFYEAIDQVLDGHIQKEI